MNIQKELEALITIDLCYYRLKDLHFDLSRSKSPINTMIDEATGYDKEQIKDVIILMEDLIKAKKFISADYSADIKLLKQVRLLK